jgi:hypothetical protein
MDILRSCYRSQMRLYPDRPDVLTWGRWHRCPPNAIVAPLSVFFSRQWEKEDEPDQDLGEVYRSSPPWFSGRSDRRLTGLHYCGTRAWLFGIPYAERPGLVLDTTGMPECCQALPPSPPRLVVGGSGTSSTYFIITGGSVCECETASGGNAVT